MLDKTFDPKTFEKNFSFDVEASVRKPNAEPFMVLLPPPNVTGSLHIGHALCYTLQDILVRYKRMRGFDVLFQPGLDHAGIVTQLLVEKQLYANGVEKGSLTREGLLKEIWFWKENSGGKILDQMKKLGVSCDFSRLRFTMDDGSKKAVTKMFVKLYEDGYLYRGKKMVNWDPLIGSAISDLEVVEKEIEGGLWYIKYQVEGSSENIIVATTRPETLFGDTAVAVNPRDERYRHLIGKNVIVPLTDRSIPVIADKYADPEKGTGAVKITPAHDFNDFEVGQRHKLPIIDIMNSKGELNNNVPEIFRKMDRFEARQKVVELLEKKGLIEKFENIKHKVPYGDRSGVILEPRLTYQWFVNAERLAAPAIAVVKQGKINFIPKHWENLYFEWLNNIRPWCVSRQIWWGHRIPAWYGPDGQIFVAETEAEAKKKAVAYYGKNCIELKQDDDVLDTWFSSGMWPFITLGWPEKTKELERFYSNMIVVTGFDIIFFWVSRMIMLGIYNMKKVPFPNVYIHSLVRDEKGQKMSKSKGNVIDPLDLCETYGADAVRYTLASLASPGRDIKMNSRLVETGRNFLTKIWNVMRFAQMNGCTYNKDIDFYGIKHPIAQWIVVQVKKMVKDLEIALDNYRFDDATKIIYQCVWGAFCDWYMELIKPILQKTSLDTEIAEGYDLQQALLKKDIRDVTSWCILQFVRALYPISPFISKKLSGELGVTEMSWPDVDAVPEYFNDSVRKVELLKDAISAIRSVRQFLHISVSEKLNVNLDIQDSDISSFVSENRELLNRMAGVALSDNVASRSVSVVISGATLKIAIPQTVDVENEKRRLIMECGKLKKQRDDSAAKLSNEDFMSKAPAEVVDEHKQRVSEMNEKIERIEFIIRGLGNA
ncbi:MAG: valine--tRNA ligase [Alphaproteobacteria bacterium]|nr:valine--tRNA ligase [Alphaproteobacteria bacterium]